MGESRYPEAPRVDTRPLAQHYANAGERIIALSSDGGGCLMSLRVVDGCLRIEVYRADGTVSVIHERGK